MRKRQGALRAAVAVFGLLALMILAARCRAAEPEAVLRQRARVVAEYPHDTSAYTQGLLWHDGALFESTGQYGSSRVRRVDLQTGSVEDELVLADADFGEGLARVEERLIQLTWREGRAYVYDLRTLDQVEVFDYEGEGWGLCYDGAQLWMSNGTAQLQRRDARSFAWLGEVTVLHEGKKVGSLNELECAEGWIYANVYETDYIVRIEPASGRVTAVIDAAGLLTESERQGADVLNGIAYDPVKEAFYLTGKWWPRLFEVRFE